MGVEERAPRLGHRNGVDQTVTDGDGLEVDLRVATPGVHLQDVGGDRGNVVASIALTWWRGGAKRRQSVSVGTTTTTRTGRVVGFIVPVMKNLDLANWG